MKKKILSLLLAILMAFPSSAVIAAAESVEEAAANATERLKGDINADGIVNILDVLALFRHSMMPTMYPLNYPDTLDFDSNGMIDIGDSLKLFQHSMMPEFYPVPYSVKFYDGDRLIDILSAEREQPLGVVPSVEKSSKPNAILLGYFTDPECTQPFYAENPVTGDMNVYAKYEDMGPQETLNFTSFAQMDQSPDLCFKISGTGNPAEAVTLEVMDGSAPVELAFTPTENGYTVYAPTGFNEGCSYQLHLADGWTFTGKADTIRTASFSIFMEEVENLQMSDDIVYLMDTDAIHYIVGGQSYDVLTSSLISEEGGFFTCENADGLAKDDILCIYADKHPDERDNGGDTLLPVVYVKVDSVNGDKITFRQLSAEDQQKLYDIPDNFPILIDALPVGTTGNVNISALDTAMYATMMGEGYDLAKAKESIAAGDFITLYVSEDSITSEADLYYAEITGYNPSNGEITYKQTTKQTILDSMDLYAKSDLQGSDFITDEEKAEMEKALLAQVEESGFAEDAAFMLADMITKTDAFRSTKGIRSFIITDEDGNKLSAEDIELLNLGASFEISDGVKLTVELVTEGDQLRYDSGVQVAIGIDADLEVELNDDDDKIAINLSATFVQEVALNPRVKGSIVYKEILWIPVPVGVNVGATIDIRSFTAFSFEAEIFTVAAEDESLWGQFKDVVNNPEKLADLSFLPEELSDGLKTAGDLFDKIEELQDNVKKAQDKAEQYNGYLEDIEMLWGVIEENGLTTKEDYEAMCKALDKTSITSDLLEMMNMTNETGLEAKYYESMEALMERYSEMLEKESDWVKLVECEIFKMEQCFYGIAIGTEIKFVVRADMSLAIGSNLQYEVGKRNEFWFKIGLFKPSAGSSTMDLLDEHFAFQFYVMGRLGLKAGINAQIYVGLGTGDFAKVGIYTELGPYIKIYGFFIYEYEKFRAANTSAWVSDERMAGAIFMEFGLYFILGFEASALGDLFSYSYDFLDVEIPLLSIGEDRFYYSPDYLPEEDEIVLVKDVDGNSTTGITMTLPREMLGLKYVHMTEGHLAIEYMDYSKFIYNVSNPNFSIDPATGEISVTVPEDTRYLECDLTVTYKYGKLAFSTYDMSITVPLVWTNLSTAELSEYYTAAVRVGNNSDGYTTVWSKRILKNKEFDLPNAEELMEIISWNEYKYDIGTGYGSQQLEALTLIENEAYDFNIGYDTYSITVSGVQNSDGTVADRTYYAKYGKSFDFSDLTETGTTDYENGVFTKFSGLTAPEGIDISKAIDTRMAEKLKNGVVLTANYGDNSVTATFTFIGISAEDVDVKLRRGDIPSIDEIEAVAADHGMAIKEIFPAIGVLNGSNTYQIVCGELNTPPATITFEENGGSAVNDITKPYGSMIGVLPTPTKNGYDFAGWYADKELTTIFDLTKMPEGGATVYAKWIGKEYTIGFHVNGGNELDAVDATKIVVYGKTYGTLPTPERTGYGFIGWFTAPEGGKQVTSGDVYSLTTGQTLYAQWRLLVDIPDSIFDFGAAEQYTYERYAEREVTYSFIPEEGAGYSLDEFTFKYMAQGDSEYAAGLPINAGTYNVTISRPADNTYAKFEKTYSAVVTIAKTTRNLSEIPLVEQTYMAYTAVGLEIQESEYDRLDIDPNATIQYRVGTRYSKIGSNLAERLEPAGNYNMYVNILNDRNYFDAELRAHRVVGNDTSPYAVTAVLSKASWQDSGRYDTSWYNDTDTEFVIDTAEELAGLAYLVNNGNTFERKTVRLGADINLTHNTSWVPIGISRTNSFGGIFDGDGHVIRQMAVPTAYTYMGLFGYVWGGRVKNVTVLDSYIGNANAGSHVGGIAGTAVSAVVDRCEFHGVIRGIGSEDSSGVGGLVGTTASTVIICSVSDCVVYGKYNAGGVLGYSTQATDVASCVSYSEVNGTGGGYGTGGIVGTVDAGLIYNCANLGNINGVSSVGGVVGLIITDEGDMYNCYTAGKVYGSATSYIYVGAVIGRNKNNNGYVSNVYYLKGSASNYKGTVKGAGTKSGSEDSAKNLQTGYFTSPTSQMQGSYFTGGILIDVLNAWCDKYSKEDYELAVQWVSDGFNSYPIPNIAD